MELKYEITEEDYINFNLYHLENSPSQKKTYHLLRYAMPALFSAPVYAIGTSLFKQPSIPWIIIAVVFSAWWMITYPKKHKKLIKKQMKKFLNEGDNSSIFGKRVMMLDEKDIKVVGENSFETTSKERIQEVKVYEDMILVYLSGISAHIIPSRCLTGETKERLLKELKYRI